MAVEQHGSINPHMHGLLLVNGNIKQDYMFILIEIEKQWRQAISSNNMGLVDFCNRFGENGIMIDRNKIDFLERLNTCFYQASYIAKLRGKAHRSKGS